MTRCVQAWDDLSTCRAIGMASGPIPVTAIWSWCDRRELDAEAAELVEHVVRTLDIEHAQAEASRRATEQATGPRARGRSA